LTGENNLLYLDKHSGKGDKIKMSKRMVGFRADDPFLKRIEQLSSKLGLDFSSTIRLCVDETIKKYLHLQGNLVVLEKEKYDRIFNMLSNLLKDWARREFTPERLLKDIILKQPGMKKLMKLAEEDKLEIKEKP